MKRKSKKSYLQIVVLLVVNIFSFTGCVNKNIGSENSDKDILKIEKNENDRKAITIMNTEITNVLNAQNRDIETKIENNSNFYISNIWLEYEELDKKKNILSTSQTFLDLTLSPKEVSSISFTHNEYTNSIKVIGYGYESEGEIVHVNLKNDEIKVTDSEKNILKSKDYELLAISKAEKDNESNNANIYMVKIKNLSQKELGNISLKIGELSKEGEYVAVNHLPAYNVLKPSEEIEVEILASADAYNIKIIGYSYDDIKEKANVDINLKSHRAIINK